MYCFLLVLLLHMFLLVVVRFDAGRGLVDDPTSLGTCFSSWRLVRALYPASFLTRLNLLPFWTRLGCAMFWIYVATYLRTGAFFLLSQGVATYWGSFLVLRGFQRCRCGCAQIQVVFGRCRFRPAECTVFCWFCCSKCFFRWWFALTLFSFPLGAPKVPLRTPAKDHFLLRLSSDLGGVLLFSIAKRLPFCFWPTLGCVTFFVWVASRFLSTYWGSFLLL